MLLCGYTPSPSRRSIHPLGWALLPAVFSFGLFGAWHWKLVYSVVNDVGLFSTCIAKSGSVVVIFLLVVLLGENDVRGIFFGQHSLAIGIDGLCSVLRSPRAHPRL